MAASRPLLQYASDLFDPDTPAHTWAVPHAAVVGRSGAEHPSERARDLRTRDRSGSRSTGPPTPSRIAE